MRTLDLRSDTVTLPTPGMREAMAQAELGDDVYGEDPTVRSLEERIAEVLGKERAMFFPSGTMANQACLRLLTRAGDVVLGSKDCHIQRFEAGAAAGLSGLHIERLGDEGRFDAAQLRAALPPDDPHFAPASVVAIENTHNAAGGRVFPKDMLDAIVVLARERGLSLHLDGARLFNAAVASGRPPAELAAPFDTVSVCLSKGLGAPVGSVVATNASRMGALLRIRKMLGGGMRQAGMLAAAGLYALEHHVERLAKDHTNASRLAEGLAELGCEVTAPETNIVMFRVPDLEGFLTGAANCGVRVGRFDATRLRAVTHLDISAEDIGEALTRMKGLFRT
ncbi:MAG: aminotransferase class I/II-fold pyridoxal phosphate-dependent enzyme [Deltaproteobacteria bacterium]|nr:aminotransferase class I/II-fold pyridoxal phosphate-dependent enzyme [Deltaproteobacteria bacterium]MBW2393287.1 aminotransferase class I/II-fold pyridoxal phosphate-dependent enzyme [Deltaproteobacteria bacterium]